MDGSRDYAYYKVWARDVKLGDITSSERNKNIIQKLRNGDSHFQSLYILEEERNGDDEEFIVQQSDDLGWLGYFIGESKTLRLLYISCNPPPPIGLLQGICRNQSIQSLEVENIIVDTTFIHLAPFFGSNSNLTRFMLGCDRMGSDLCARNFAMALVKCDSLTCLCFEVSADGGQFSDDAFNDIIFPALNFLPQLEELSFDDHYIEGEGYATLSNILRLGGMGKLRVLDLISSGVNDAGLQSLVAGMRYCRNLLGLDLYGNNQITVTGLRTLSDFFQSESCRLESLNLASIGIDDEGAIILATGLTTYKPLKHLNLSQNDIGDEGIAALVSGLTIAANTSLETLRLSDNPFTIAGVRLLSILIQSERSCLKLLGLGSMIDGDEAAEALILANALANNTSLMYLGLYLGYHIHKEGEDTFSRLLCDTSSISNIYSSNHTLESIGDLRDRRDPTHDDIRRYLILNRNTSRLNPIYRRLVPMCKILIHHPDLADMKPFYKWKLKVLPMIADWFQKAKACQNYFEESAKTFQRRELSAMYRFIRGVPLLVADGYWSQQLKQVRVKKRQFEEEEKEIREKKSRVEEEEMQVLDRLSG
ncbi:leucine-rich repeat protein [Skeletonema marinoi]|uniref:Leucine-rich repeat protein n=1 Tax=Skeletonema marinoi TaxID=267567 RepID=A0AAD9D6C1_9STRA|nr:leucine-rich repeat protein [Skeletonema marinoi]